MQIAAPPGALPSVWVAGSEEKGVLDKGGMCLLCSQSVPLSQGDLITGRRWWEELHSDPCVGAAPRRLAACTGPLRVFGWDVVSMMLLDRRPVGNPAWWPSWAGGRCTDTHGALRLQLSTWERTVGKWVSLRALKGSACQRTS